MTLSECKARIRHARRLMLHWRNELNSHTRGKSVRHLPAGLNIAREDYEAMQWGVAHLCKVWVYDEYDADGEPVKSSARYIRPHFGFTKNDGTENFYFKGLPVRCAEPVGYVLSEERF